MTRALRAGAVTAVIQYLFALAVFPIIVHRLGPDLYGAWAAIASLLAVGALADAGIRTEIIRRVGLALGKKDHDELKSSLRTGVGILAVTAAAVLVVGLSLAPAIRSFAFPGGVHGYEPGDLDNVLRATIALLALGLVADGHFAVLRGVQRSDIEVLATFAGLLPGAALTVALAFAGFGLWALFLGAALQALVRWTIQWTALRRLLPDLRFGLTLPRTAAARSFLGSSGLLLFIQISDVIDSQWDRVVLARFVGPASVAFFSVGVLLVLQAKAVIVIPLSPILTTVTELQSRDSAAMERTYFLLSRVASVTSTVLLGGLFVLGPAFIRLWLGPGFANGGTAIRLFTVAVALNLLVAAAAMRCVGLGWYRAATVPAMVNVVVNGVASFVLAATLGFIGPLLGSIIGTTAGILAFFLILASRTRDRWILPRLAAPIIGVGLAAISIVTRLDNPQTWLNFGITAAGLGLVLLIGGLLAERLPLRGLLTALDLNPFRKSAQTP